LNIVMSDVVCQVSVRRGMLKKTIAFLGYVSCFEKRGIEF